MCKLHQNPKTPKPQNPMDQNNLLEVKNNL